MTWATGLLRLMLLALLAGLVMAVGLVWIVGLDLARAFPEVAHLRLPAFAAVAVGCVPAVLAVPVAFELLGLVDRGQASSARAVGLLRRLEVLWAAAAAYALPGVVGVSLALGMVQFQVLLAGAAVEVVALTLLAGSALLARLSADAAGPAHARARG